MGVPLLRQVHSQHHGQRVWRAPTVLAGLGIVQIDQIDQIDQGALGDNNIHLHKKLLVLGLILSGGLLAVRETE